MRRRLRRTICDISPLPSSLTLHVPKTRRNMLVFIKLLRHSPRPCRLRVCVYTVVLLFTHRVRTTRVKKNQCEPRSLVFVICDSPRTVYWKNVGAFFFICIRVSDRTRSFRVFGSRHRYGTRLLVRQLWRSVRDILVGPNGSRIFYRHFRRLSRNVLRGKITRSLFFFYDSRKANINSTSTLVSSLLTYRTYVVRSVSETPVNEYTNYAFRSKRQSHTPMECTEIESRRTVDRWLWRYDVAGTRPIY